MSQNTTNQSDDQEIDLGLLIKKANGFFGNISLGKKKFNSNFIICHWSCDGLFLGSNK
jgi:hypothetical protein